MKYQNKPFTVEAMRWAWGTNDARNDGSTTEEVVAWVNDNGGEARYEAPTFDPSCSCHKCQHAPRIAIRTFNGWTYARPGQYIVMGTPVFTVEIVEEQPDGELVASTKNVRDFHPVNPTPFESIYEPVTEVQR